MRAREKLTVEEKISIALDLIKRDRTLEQIRDYYRVSHTTVYKIRNAFLDGGRRALGGVDKPRGDLEARVRALEKRVGADASEAARGLRAGARSGKPRRGGIDSRVR
jgi:hypothetical protein